MCDTPSQSFVAMFWQCQLWKFRHQHPEEWNRGKGAATVEEILDHIGSRVRERSRADGAVRVLYESVPVLDHVLRSSWKSPASTLLAERKARGLGGIVAQRRRLVTERRTQDARAKVTQGDGRLNHRFHPHLCARASFVTAAQVQH